MGKESVVYIHNGVLFGHEEKQNVICRKTMELEIITLSEISQTKRDKNHMFSIIGRL
jgi:hypothetical protein